MVEQAQQPILDGTGDGGRFAAIGMQAQPLVSVVIPTRNRATLVVRAINSVCRQTHTNLEIIVIDDASTDNTAEAVGSLKDSRIRYLRHPASRGGSAARNTGIRAASGKYLAFLDDDDEWLPEKTKVQLSMLKEYDAVLCSSDSALSAKKPENKTKTVTLDDLRDSPYAQGGTGVLMAHSEVLRDLLFDESLPRCQDWDLFIRIVRKYRVGFLDQPLLKYNNGDHNRLSNVLINLQFADLEKRLVMLDKHREFFGPVRYRRHACRMLLYGVWHRSDKVAHILRTARRCGTKTTVSVLASRLRDKCFEEFVRLARRWMRTSARSTQARAANE